MAFSKTLASRFAKIRAAASSSPAPSISPCSPNRLIHRRPFFPAIVPSDRLSLPNGDDLIATLRGMRDERIRLEVLLRPPPPANAGMTVEEVRKVLRASQMEAARSRLRSINSICVSYDEFLQICCEVSSAEQGPGIARSLDESGTVIVFGDAVFLRPDQVAKVIQSMIPLPDAPQRNQQRNELRVMEERKAAIDKKAEAQVRTELWGGLGFFVAQTAWFMRLTFWELSWDVMEPICFFTTSIYVMAGYTFFMRTSREPSFEGFFQSRFAAKQNRLMKANNFDWNRFDELRRACYTVPVKELRSSTSFL